MNVNVCISANFTTERVLLRDELGKIIFSFGTLSQVQRVEKKKELLVVEHGLLHYNHMNLKDIMIESDSQLVISYLSKYF